MKLLVFAGQGSQFRGMGKLLFSKFPKETEKASDILGYSIQELCTADPGKQLHLTQFTQPALYVVNALTWMDQRGELGRVEYLMGHSLGEYNALHAAGAFSFETGLRLVQERGRLMGNASGGGMLAVLGITVEELQHFLHTKNLIELNIANYNTATQLVLSGPRKVIDQAITLMENESFRAIPLNVSAAFHSPYMKNAAKVFGLFLQDFSFEPLSIPVIANTTARPYQADQISQTLAQQIESPVLWNESIRYLMAKEQTLEFRELGNNPVLSKMIATIQSTEDPLLLPSEQEPILEKVEDTSEGIKVAVKGKVSEFSITMDKLGSRSFQKRYGIKYSYLTGAMYRGIASKEMVLSIGKAGLLGFLGTGGMDLEEIEENLQLIQQGLSGSQAYGMNLLCNLHDPQVEMDTVELYLKYGVTCVEAAAFMMMTPALVYFRIKGLERDILGNIQCKHKIIAKISRPEVAKIFLSPPPERIVKKLLDEGKISWEESVMAKEVAMSFDLCVEADSGGHTDQGIPTVLLPSIQSMTRELQEKYQYSDPIHIGLAGGIGTPEAAASAFIMGADFILTGSINQCSVEAKMSAVVKTMLQDINVQDTEYAPAGDMFELGAKVQVLRRGVFFPARANKLFMLYSHYNSLDEIPEKIKTQLEEKYFKKTFQEIWEETKGYFEKKGDQYNLKKAEKNQKHKMALVFRWYFNHSAKLALAGEEKNRIDFQIHTGPALGAFNQWVKGTQLESWENRHVDLIAEKLMGETAQLLTTRLKLFQQ